MVGNNRFYPLAFSNLHDVNGGLDKKNLFPQKILYHSSRTLLSI
jgi:hypothetical protein